MGKPRNSFEHLARKAAARLNKARAAGEQLSLLPEPGEIDQGEAGSVGRSKGKATNQMRDWLAAHGYRMPEDQLAQMAGLGSAQDPVLAAMERAELVLAWAYDGQKGKDGVGITPTGGQRLNAFQQIYTAQLRAADALLPYGAPKATPDQVVQQNVQVVVPAAPSMPRDVTPQMRRITGRMVPADVIVENERKQGLGDDGSVSEPDAIRTGEASD